jgi:hypothetical protein
MGASPGLLSRHVPPPPLSVQVDDSEVIQLLLHTEIIPLCLRIMETGAELSKTVSEVLRVCM